GARRRAGLVLRRMGPARPAVAAVGMAAGGAPRALCRLPRRCPPGRGTRGLVDPPLALCRDRQAADAAVAPVAAGPSLRHGLAVAGHRGRGRDGATAADALPARGAGARARGRARRRGGAAAVALVTG